MKAVILAGGLGTRMREETEFKPKPMVEVGGKPVLWHIMSVLAAQGVNEFIVCIGYKGEVIRDYFWNFASKNLDFTVNLAEERNAQFHGSSAEASWKVTVAETGPLTPTGGRLYKVRQYVSAEEPFLVTYGDGIANVDLRTLEREHLRSGNTVTISTARPRSRFGVVDVSSSGQVQRFREKPEGSELVNIGYMMANTDIFQFLAPDSTLETDPLESLARLGKLGSVEHKGFWQPMDTPREAAALNELWETGAAPWKIWQDEA